MKVAVIGGGSWGTALADLLAGKGTDTTLWVREQELAELIRSSGENSWYHPGFTLDPRLQVESDLLQAAEGADVLLFVVPCQFFRGVLQELKPVLPDQPVIVCANKGIEIANKATVSQMVFEELDGLSPRYAILSGPSFAKEVSQKVPTAIVLGCEHAELARDLQELFSTEFFRVYTNPDYRGVELGGAVKNVIAIAAGISDGLEFGHNARAALITRGLAEMSRLGVDMGGLRETFMGLAGMGDLVLTCTGDLSRNRQVGLRLGQGRSLEEIISEMKAVAEGVKTTKALHELALERGVQLPITEQVHAILYEGRDPALAVKELMTRELKEEHA